MTDLSNPPDAPQVLAQHRVPWFKTAKGLRTLIGSAVGIVVVIVAIVLLVTLVVQPNQRATQAAAASASASAQAAQDYQDAVTAFNTAADACKSADQQLASAIRVAQSIATTDPSTMQDPTLIDKLNQAITTAQAVKTCAAPTMASDTATIQQQTTQMGTDNQAVTAAAATLTSAGQAVPASVAAKQQAAAQAQASASAAAQAQATQLVNSTSLTATDANGYKAAITLKCTNWIKGSDTADTMTGWQNAGGTGAVPIASNGNYGGNSVSDTTMGAFAFCTIVVNNASPGYKLSGWGGSIPQFFISGQNNWFDRSSSSVECVIYSDQAECSGMAYGLDVRMSIPAASNQWGPVPVVLYADNVFTPNYPNGDPLLGSTTLSISYNANSYIDQTSNAITIMPSWT